MTKKTILTLAVAATMTAGAVERIVFVGAHPDDTEGFAATAFLLKDRYELHVVDLTRGELGLGRKGLEDGSTARIRVEEEKNACALLGATPHFLDEIDGDACAGMKSVDRLAQLLADLKPVALFTHWPVDAHSDHMQTSAVVRHAVKKSKWTGERYYYEVIVGETKNWWPLYSVDVTSTMDRKDEMMRKYACQNHDDWLVKTKREQAALRGEQRIPCCAYAETFTTFDGLPVANGVLEKLPQTVRVRSMGEYLSARPGTARPVPRPQLLMRINSDFEVMGIVHWGLNTFTDREWGFGNENPADLAPTDFDADQIVGACRDGGLQGLVIVAKHHDGFCLWPTKTTPHNITKAVSFRGGKGDYVREMERACRKANVRFGIYVSPWDRNSADYGSAAYVDNVYQAQVKELLGGAYGDVFELWCDGANGGTGWYGGVAGEKGERRRIGMGYYRFEELFAWARSVQRDLCVFHSEDDGSDLRYPGNEQGRLDPDCRATSQLVGGFAGGVFGNPNYPKQMDRGDVNGARFRMVEADLPLRPGWFYHAKERGRVKHAAYLLKLYLGVVGNGGILNLGIAPDRRGRLDDEDVRSLKGFRELKDAFFAKEVTGSDPFNVVVLSEDVSWGEQVDGWEFRADGKPLLSGKAIGRKRIRVLDAPVAAAACELKVTASGPVPGKTSFRRYLADPALVELVQSATTSSGETDTFKWMTGREREKR